MNPTAIYSKSGKGVQEASGKTSLLARADRMVLAAFDGRATLGEVAQKCGKSFDAAFEQVVAKLDRDGFIREVLGMAAPATPSRPQAKPAAPKPPTPSAPAEDLDFSALSVPVSKPATAAAPLPKATPQAAADAERRMQEQASTLAKARQEAEARLQRDRDRLKSETEAKLRAEMEATLRAEAAGKGQADLEARMRAEADAKVKAAREAAVRATAEAKAKAEAEMKAKVEQERKAREEAERVRKEAEEKARREAEDLKKRLEEERARAEAERKAREEENERRKRAEEAERKAREEAERMRKEAEEKARAEAEALRKQLEEERRKLEAERKARAEEDERRKRADEEREQKRRAEEENERKRRAEEENERKRRAEEQSHAAEAEARRVAQEKASAAAAAAAAETTPRAVVPPPPPAAAPAENFDDNLLADLESFDRRDEDDQKAKQEAERKARADEDERRKRVEQAARKARDEADSTARQAAEKAQRDEDSRRAREEEEREEQARRVKELLAAASKRSEAPAPAAQDDDIGVTDDDLDMDDVKQDERVLSAAAKREARQRDAAKAETEEAEAAVTFSRRRPIKWGKLAGTVIAVAVIGGLAWVHLMPVPAADYEKAASAALGRPVKIGSARFSLFTGIQLRFQNVSIGNDVKLATVRANPQASALFGGRKAFNRIDVEGVTMPENTLGEVLFGKHKTETFSVRRLVVHDLKLGAPLVLPALDADFTFADDGALQTAVLTGPEGLLARLTPKASEVEFDMTAARFALPMAPDVSLSQFAMKGTASARGMKVDSWDGALFEGRFAGAADLRWGQNWEVQGPITVRGINAAVFAPALLSEGKADGTGRYTMSGANPEKLMDAVHVEGNFTINKGTLGNIDLSRAIQTGGRQWSGRTQFNEMNGQGVYDKGSVALRNLTIAAGALNAGASVDVAQTGALSGRIVADVKTASQNVRATLNLGGTAKEPQVRN
jgi:hypothetical protein